MTVLTSLIVDSAKREFSNHLGMELQIKKALTKAKINSCLTNYCVITIISSFLIQTNFNDEIIISTDDTPSELEAALLAFLEKIDDDEKRKMKGKKAKLLQMLHVIDSTEEIAKKPKLRHKQLPDVMFMSDTTLEAWRLVIHSSIGLTDELFVTSGFDYVLTGRFYQDPIEVIKV